MYNHFSDLAVFDDLPGLSCVENLLLYILKSSHYSYKYLFFNSFLKFEDILDAFINENAVYANFTKVPRIQNIAVEVGMVEMSLYNSLQTDAVDTGHMMITVKPEYIKDRYNVELWRDDHYILIQRAGNQYTYINDNPRDIGDISVGKLHDIFDGKSILFKLKGDIRPDSMEKHRQNFICNLKCMEQRIDLLQQPILDYMLLRDALGVYRLLTRRLYDFASLFMSADFVLPQVKYLDRQYMRIEYMRRKNKTDNTVIVDLLRKIQESEEYNISKVISSVEDMQ